MKLDIVFVAYNSEKWIEGCFESIIKSEYNLKDISVIVVDNYSSDKTVEKLISMETKMKECLNDFKVVKSDKNLGFGKGNNLGFKQGHSDHVLFLNIDTEVYANTFTEIENNIKASDRSTGVWELRQFPYEHPKIYNPVTLTTSWVSGAAFVVRRDVFEQVGGFDTNIFMYAEDVDLSWRIRVNGYNLKYIPKAIVNHYAYASAGEVKPNQYYNSLINNILLRYKFGRLSDLIKGYYKLLKVIAAKEPFENSRKQLLVRIAKHFFQTGPYIGWKFKNFMKLRKFKPNFYGWDYETIRNGAFYVNELPIERPLVSIIVRTCGRPDMLRETLISLKNQTYENLEVVIVEDGVNLSEEMITKEFGDLNIVYKASGKKVGRSRAGNMAMDMATGKYINFLDDDDVFYSDHVEVLVKQLELNKDYRIAYSLAFETPIQIFNKSPYKYKIDQYNLMHNQKFNRVLLFHHNYIPIQTIMFEKSVYLEEGGIDETLDVLEDWDLWVRYACKNNFLYIDKVTSKYRVPFEAKISNDRQKLFDDALVELRKKHAAYNSNINVLTTADDLQDIYGSFVFAVTKESFNKMYSKHPRIVKIAFKFIGLGGRIVRLKKGGK
jgi:GT2 family glycosyltransferase